MSIALDATTPVSASSTTQTCVSSSFAATQSGTVMLLAVQCGTGSLLNSVASISDSSGLGLTWTKQVDQNFYPAGLREITLWTAPVPVGQTFSGIVTVTLNAAATYSSRLFLCAVDGANLSTPIDPNANNPQSNNNAGAQGQSNTVTGLSTTNPNCILFHFICSDSSLGVYTPPSGFSNTVTGGTASALYYKVVSAAQSNASFAASWTGTSDYNAAGVLAIQAASTVNSWYPVVQDQIRLNYPNRAEATFTPILRQLLSGTNAFLPRLDDMPRSNLRGQADFNFEPIFVPNLLIAWVPQYLDASRPNYAVQQNFFFEGSLAAPVIIPLPWLPYYADQFRPNYRQQADFNFEPVLPLNFPILWQPDYADQSRLNYRVQRDFIFNGLFPAPVINVLPWFPKYPDILIPNVHTQDTNQSLVLSEYNNICKVTVNHLLVSTVNHTDLTNFPMLISGIYANLATVANGGTIYNTVSLNGQTVPADLIFTSDIVGNNLLSWEVASYNAVTGQIEIWINIPTLSHNADTIIYMWHGNAAVTTYQCTATNTWDSNYSGVWHLADGTTLSYKDSTSNALNGSSTSNPSATAGQIDGGSLFVGSSQQFINLGTSSVLNYAGKNTATVEAWVKRTTSNSTGGIYSKGGVFCFAIGVSPATTNQIKMTKFGVADLVISGIPADTNWHHLVGTWGTGGEVLYVDGVSVGTGANTSNFASSALAAYLGYEAEDTAYLSGSLDEVRVSNITRTADWIITEYNNQNSPNSFYFIDCGGDVSAMWMPQYIDQLRQNLRAQADFFFETIAPLNLQLRWLPNYNDQIRLNLPIQRDFITQTPITAPIITVLPWFPQYPDANRLNLRPQADFIFESVLALNLPMPWLPFYNDQSRSNLLIQQNFRFQTFNPTQFLYSWFPQGVDLYREPARVKGESEFTFPTPVIGGTTVGTVGTGIYSGYTLVAGDDFQNALDIMGEEKTGGRYIVNSPTAAIARIRPSPNNQRYAADPLHTGYLDSNRGIPVGFTDIMMQTNSVLALKSRILTGGEAALCNSKTYAFSGAWSTPSITFTAPAIIEFYANFPTGMPAGVHPTIWVQQTNPADVQNGLEFDLAEGSSQYASFNINVHGTVGGGWSSNVFSLQSLNLYGASYHLYTLILDTTGASLYVDGVLAHKYTGDTTLIAAPYNVIMTNVLYAASWNGDTGINASAWTAAGAAGAVFSIDYFRIWLPNAKAKQIVQHINPLPNQQVAYNAAISYIFPTSDAIWGAGNYDSDYLQALRQEDFEPGGDTSGTAIYTQFPAGLSLAGRVLSGSLTGSTNKPGRLNLIAVPNKAGGSVGYTAQGYIDVGPNITTTTQNLINGVSYSHDLYTECDCGTLLPKIISVGTLPAGLSFDGISVISGTPVGTGTLSVPISVTNSSGQTLMTNINFVTTGTLNWFPLYDQMPRLNLPQRREYYFAALAQNINFISISWWPQFTARRPQELSAQKDFIFEPVFAINFPMPWLPQYADAQRLNYPDRREYFFGKPSQGAISWWPQFTARRPQELSAQKDFIFEPVFAINLQLRWLPILPDAYRESARVKADSFVEIVKPPVVVLGIPWFPNYPNNALQILYQRYESFLNVAILHPATPSGRVINAGDDDDNLNAYNWSNKWPIQR